MLVAVNIDVMIAAAKSRLNLAITSQKIAYMTASASSPPSCSGTISPSVPDPAALGELPVALLREVPRLVVLPDVVPPDVLLHEGRQRVEPQLLFVGEPEVHQSRPSKEPART